MKKIETQNDLTTWAKQVNTPGATICDLQDVFARSNTNDLYKYFMETPQNDKELLVFSISKCMGSATLLDFITIYSRRKAESYIESEGQEADKRWGQVVQAEFDFENEKKMLLATIENLKHQNAELVKDNNDMTRKLSDKTVQIMNMYEELGELRIELDKQYTFESHIKGLINA